MELVKRESSKKGVVAVGAAIGTVVFFSLGWWYLGVMGVLATLGLGVWWWKHRASWGIRF